MKVGLLLICTGEAYWPYAKQLIESARTHFLPGKDVDYLLWTDMPSVADESTRQRVEATYINMRMSRLIHNAPDVAKLEEKVKAEAIPYSQKGVESVDFVLKFPFIKIIPTEHTDWPYPTLMRYNLFLAEEERLKQYDYLFYCDIDMVMVDTVGDEIIGTGITAALHPMYCLRHEYQAPFESNPLSAAFIPATRFYYAGGFQGGKTQDFVTAMKEIKKGIDKDFAINYTARWNDESHWNHYLYYNPPSIILTPAYIYPDSLINEYYVKLWGCDYPKKIITLTKPLTLSSEGGDHVKQFIQTA